MDQRSQSDRARLRLKCARAVSFLKLKARMFSDDAKTKKTGAAGSRRERGWADAFEFIVNINSSSFIKNSNIMNI